MGRDAPLFTPIRPSSRQCSRQPEPNGSRVGIVAVEREPSPDTRPPSNPPPVRDPRSSAEHPFKHGVPAPRTRPERGITATCLPPRDIGGSTTKRKWGVVDAFVDHGLSDRRRRPKLIQSCRRECVQQPLVPLLERKKKPLPRNFMREEPAVHDRVE
jgi:hypothetical protein